jgi:hypothetical protein
MTMLSDIPNATTASILDFKMTTMIDTSELSVMVKGQLGKGRF